MNIKPIQYSTPRTSFKGHITDDALKYAFHKSYTWYDQGPSITCACNDHMREVIDGIKNKLSKKTIIDICYDTDTSGKLKPCMLVRNTALKESMVMDFNLFSLYPSKIEKLDEALLGQFENNMVDKLVKTGDINEVEDRVAHANFNYGTPVPYQVTEVAKYVRNYENAMSQLEKFKKAVLNISEDNYALKDSYEIWQKSGAILDKKI